ncbi:hypothetical protein PHLCEN_2v4839 [Hermanssonia centrifuga]|uniref:Uncharacterized protein n=1 Tax=Hermanssonia centrifuga TaxID=98765 RepID=A0A2R6PG68_9APHY|nr:hypothetical protein PHLCEN_2v4839 [Hermanssonia centrifuga]
MPSWDQVVLRMQRKAHWTCIVETRQFTAAPKLEKTPGTTSILKSDPSVEESVTGKGKRKRAANQKKGMASAKNKAASNTRGKGKQKAKQPQSDDDEANESSEDGEEARSLFNLPPKRSTRRKRGVTGGYREDSEDETPGVAEDVAMVNDESALAIAAVEDPVVTGDGPSMNALNDTGLLAMDETEDGPSPTIKTEEPEPMLRATTPMVPSDTIVVDQEPEIPLDHHPQARVNDADTLLPDADDEEEKPKPIMKLQYQGFSVHGRCLCVIVEPYPPVRPQRDMTLVPTGLTGPRAPSIAPPDFVASGAAQQRERTPLFFPDPDFDREETPAPARQRVRPPVPLFDEEPREGEEEEEADGGMLAFSQILQSVGGYNAGVMEDDDEMEGAVFLGDADEARGL